MAKRKTSCGNARMCSMLLTNFTRSASYEALPNHRLFPAKFGLTGPLWNRWPQRSTMKMRNAFEEGQKRGYCGSTELEIVAPRRSWREIFLWKTPTHEKLTKCREHLSQSRRHAPPAKRRTHREKTSNRLEHAL